MALSLNGTSTGSLNNISVPNETGTLATTSTTILPKIVVAARRTTSQQGIANGSGIWDSNNTPTSSTSVLYDVEVLDTYSQFDETTGIFTVDSNTVGWYEVRFNLLGYSLQNTSGESRCTVLIYKNDTSIQSRADIYETSNPDETRFGITTNAVVDLTTSGDNVRVKCAYLTTAGSGGSGGKDAQSGTNITITRLTDAS